MTEIHTFDADGYYCGTSEMPPGASGVNAAVATLDPLPRFNPETERLRRVSGVWAVELIPVPNPEPEPEPPEPQYPRFYGNAKLDLFTPAEQMAVAEAAATSPVVALTFYRMINATYVSYEDPETEQGLGVLVSAGLLSLDRKTEIVASMQPR